MTKEEFASIVSSEIESLLKRRRELEDKKVYLGVLKTEYLKSQEIQDVQYEIDLLSKQIMALQRFITLPAYERILAMSDAEIDEYKKEKISELELEAEFSRKELETAEIKLVQLKKLQEELMKKIPFLLAEDRINAINQANEVEYALKSYDESDSHGFGILSVLRSKIADIEKKQLDIKKKTAESIKSELASKIDGYDQLFISTQYLSNLADEKYDSPLIFSSVVDDPQKSREVSYYLTEYKKLKNSLKTVSSRMPLGIIPRALKNKIKNEYCYSFDDSELHDPDVMRSVISKAKEDFEKSKEIFFELGTKQNLSKICKCALASCFGRISNNYAITTDFLRKYSYVFDQEWGNYNLDDLEKLIAKKESFHTNCLKLVMKKMI